MKNKTKLFVSIAIASVAVLATVIGTRNISRSSIFTEAEEKAYTLTLDKNNKLTADDITAGEKTIKTSLGNDVTFSFNDVEVYDEATRFGILPNVGSSIELKAGSKIKGLKSIELKTTFRRGAYIVYGGDSASNITTEKRYSHYDTSWDDHVEQIIFDTPVNYFKLVNISKVSGTSADSTDKMYVEYLKMNYSCEEASVEKMKEAQSRDLLNGITVWNSKDWDISENPIDYECTDVAKSSSGYSVKFTMGAATTGWPKMVYKFANNINLVGRSFEFYGKAIAGHYFSEWVFFGTDGQALTGKIGTDASKDEFKKVSISKSTLESNLISGKDLLKVAGFSICLDAEDFKGVTRSFIIDELHVVEENNGFGLNMENVWIDDAASETKCSFEKDYSVVKGQNSSSSMKLTFANSTASADGNSDLGISFGVGGTYSDSPTLNRGILEFDMKPSLNILNSTTSSYKHQFVLNIIDGTWTGHSGWRDILPSGKSGYIAANTSDGWFHFKIDLAQDSKYNNATGGVVRIKLNFFGISTANKDTASIHIDNLNWTDVDAMESVVTPINGYKDALKYNASEPVLENVVIAKETAVVNSTSGFGWKVTKTLTSEEEVERGHYGGVWDFVLLEFENPINITGINDFSMKFEGQPQKWTCFRMFNASKQTIEFDDKGEVGVDFYNSNLRESGFYHTGAVTIHGENVKYLGVCIHFNVGENTVYIDDLNFAR